MTENLMVLRLSDAVTLDLPDGLPAAAITHEMLDDARRGDMDAIGRIVEVLCALQTAVPG